MTGSQEKTAYPNLTKYGLNSYFEQHASAYIDMAPARVSEQHRDLYKVVCENGEMHAVVSGRFAYNSAESTDFPAVGDWVMVDRTDVGSGKAIIHVVLPRKSVFARKAAGTALSAQIVAANIDIIFICMALNADFNLRRLERYLSVAWDSMATPVIVLTKADLCNNVAAKVAEVTAIGIGTDVITCSSVDDSGYLAVKSYIREGCTIALIGSSGVGKSTLINRLMGEEVLAVRETREDDKGRHTTTHRQLLLLPGGGIVIDTPGMRELQLASGDLSRTFSEIEELALQCRFGDCSHTSEPGCAVRSAIDTGILTEKRFASYLKLQKELGYEGLNSRQLEQEKIKNMFGGKGEMKQVMSYVKNKNKR